MWADWSAEMRALDPDAVAYTRWAPDTAKL